MTASTAKSAERLMSEPRSVSSRQWLRRSLSHRSMVLGGIVILLLVLSAALASLIAPYAPNTLDTTRILQSPTSENMFGTDRYGRDVFSRVVFGAQISLIVGLTVIAASGIVGTLIGLISGYIPGVDNVLMRFMDVLMAFPSFLLAIGIMALIGPRLSNVVIALSIVYTPLVARVVRGVTLQLRELQYVEAARASGATGSRILSRHILPNCVAPLTVQLTVIFALAVLAEASLSFIGAGVPPEVPSWGIILAEGRDYLQTAPWISLFSGTAITITVLAVNLLGDGLRDVTDPNLRNR